MNSEKCFLIKDLLPSYIDEVCSEETSEMIKKHLNECRDCQKTYVSMKEEISGESESKNTVEYDSELIKKIGRNVERKERQNRFVSIGAAAFIILIFIFVNLPIIPISTKDLFVSVETPSYSLSEEVYKYDTVPEKSVLMYGDATDFNKESFRKVYLNEESKGINGDFVIFADEEYVDLDNLGIVQLESKKAIKKYKTDIKEIDGKNVFVIKGVKTSIIGSFMGEATSKVTILNTDNVDGYCLKSGADYISVK